MTNSYEPIIRGLCRPLEPITTAAKPLLPKLPGVRAVLFDIYGTLLISSSGDIDASLTTARGGAFRAALAAAGIALRCDCDAGVRILMDEIAAEHQRARLAGVDYPEVDIVGMWGRTLARLMSEYPPDAVGGATASDICLPAEADLRRLALEYELRVNPVWPMPHARECLEKLHAAGLVLGVISNAQFLTSELWRTLLREDMGGFEFNKEMQYYSYRHGRAKPGVELFEMAVDALARRGIGAHQAVYVGNDMLNDMLPARAVEFRTALFAGDARSLRLREDDPRVAGVTPDIVITDLSDLPRCVL